MVKPGRRQPRSSRNAPASRIMSRSFVGSKGRSFATAYVKSVPRFCMVDGRASSIATAQRHHFAAMPQPPRHAQRDLDVRSLRAASRPAPRTTEGTPPRRRHNRCSCSDPLIVPRAASKTSTYKRSADEVNFPTTKRSRLADVTFKFVRIYTPAPIRGSARLHQGLVGREDTRRCPDTSR